MKATVLVVAGLAAALFCGWLVGHPRTSAAYSTINASACVASANIQCPNPEFLAEVKQLKSIQDDIRAQMASSAFRKLQGEIDQASGMLARLRASYPLGFDWNDQKQEFVRLPTPGPAAPAANAPKKP